LRTRSFREPANIINPLIFHIGDGTAWTTARKRIGEILIERSKVDAAGLDPRAPRATESDGWARFW
jgi:hypothetical protein